MPEQREGVILTLNSGSSSVKFALYRVGAAEELTVGGSMDRIGVSDGTFRAVRGREVLTDQTLALPNHDAALTVLLRWLHDHRSGPPVTAVGHRVVQGGPHHTRPQQITPAVLDDLRRLVPLAPNHLPGEIAGIEAVARPFPQMPQVACFDTAFHRAMPELARRFPLPRHLFDEGVERYGFHGLSYEYIVEELRREAGAEASRRVVIAHLGNGASLAAVRDGRPVDTTMGLTPLGGMVMGTRCGDLDPGVVLYLQREKGMSPDAVDELLNKRSGLLGISDISPDMKDLLDRESSDPRAAEAVGLFCRQGRKFIAAMAASAGGLDTLVFTAGMGEHSPPIRARLCEGLDFLGVRIDPSRNAANAPIISPDGSPVTVRVMKTNEELMIARQTWQMMNAE